MAKGKFIKFTDSQYEDLRTFVDKHPASDDVETIGKDFAGVMEAKGSLPADFVEAAKLYVKNYAKKRRDAALANAFKF